MNNKEQLALGILDKQHQRDNNIINRYANGGSLSQIEGSTIHKQKYTRSLPAVRYDDGGDTKQKWSDLSITDKAPWIRFLVSKGITSAKGMEDTYNKYVDGGDKEVLNWPALQSVPHHIVANPNWTDKEGNPNYIETFSPNDLQRMWPGIDVTQGYYAYNPYPGENTIMYNPNDKTVDQNTIALDGLHFMRDNETYRSFYNDLLQEMPKDPQLLFESLNDQTWDEQLSRTLTGEILNKIQSNQELTSEEKEYFYPAVDGYLRRQFAPDYMISETPGDHGYAPKYVGNQDILDKTNTIRELMESYILPEVTVTPDGLANKWYGPIVNYANDIMQGYHAEGGPLSDYVSSRTSNQFGLGGKSGDEEVPFDIGADYARGSLLARNAIQLLKNRGLTEEEAITMLNDVSYMDRLYKQHQDRMTGASLPISSEKKLSWEEASEIFDTANQETERDARNTSSLSFLDFLNNIPQEDLLRNSKETSFIQEPGRYERVRNNISPTSEQSQRIEDEMNQIMLERGHNDQYYVPYNDTDLVNGVPSNVLDSLSKYAGLTGTPPEEGIGLSRQETDFGKYPFFNFGNSTSQSGRALANSNYIQNFGGIPAEYLIRNFQYHGKGKGNEGVQPKDFSIPPLLDGFQYYNSGYYNTGDPNHQSDVTRSGLEFLNTEEGRNYWNTTGQYWYDGTYRDQGDDDNGITHIPHSQLERQHGSYPTYKGGLHSNGGILMKNREYDLSQNQINDLIKQGYQIEYV